MKQSSLFNLNFNDLLKGLIMAAGGGIVSVIVADINQNIWAFNFAALWHGAIVGALPYLVKNFLTPATPIKEVTKDADGTVTKTVISTDSVDVKVKP